MIPTPLNSPPTRSPSSVKGRDPLDCGIPGGRFALFRLPARSNLGGGINACSFVVRYDCLRKWLGFLNELPLRPFHHSVARNSFA